MALLTEHGDGGRLLAGGHSLIPIMKLRLANPAHLINLGSVAGLRESKRRVKRFESAP
jgi:carbon-monoxide dehydrogenase medium subunit